jgi:hypothetical protein
LARYTCTLDLATLRAKSDFELGLRSNNSSTDEV